MWVWQKGRCDPRFSDVVDRKQKVPIKEVPSDLAMHLFGDQLG